MEAVARTFKLLWRAENGFRIQKEGDHKILFIFDNKEDVDKILSNGPWSFDKSLVVLQRYTEFHQLKSSVLIRWISGSKSTTSSFGIEQNRWLRTSVSSWDGFIVQLRIQRLGGEAS